jgi:hypothetical protein
LPARNIALPRAPCSVTFLGGREEVGYRRPVGPSIAIRFGRIALAAWAGAALFCPGLAGKAVATIGPPGSAHRLAFLEAAVGHYPREIQLWEHPELRGRLSSLLGKRLPFFHGNMWNTGAVSRYGRWIYVTGTRLPLPGRDGAIFVADLERDTIWVWVMISGRLFRYRERAVSVDLPAEVTLFLQGWQLAGPSAGAAAPGP